MNKIGALFVIFGSLVACQKQSPNYINQTYVHKYGLEVEKDEWNNRGQGGQIITTRKDGVVITRSYDNSELHGSTTYTFPHSHLIATTQNYERGRLVAEIDHFQTGIPRQEVKQALGGGKVISTWYENGTPRAQEVYQGEILISGDYFNKNNALEAHVLAGKGKRITRTTAGLLEKEEEFLNGQKVLESIFYATGEPKIVTPYRDGKIEGQRRTFLPGGLPNAIETWKNGDQEGTTTLFAMGEKKAEIPYLKGKREGVEIRFGADGNKIEEVSWKAGKKHGPDRFFVKGEEAIDWYHEGKRVKREAFEKLNPPNDTFSR